MPVHHGVDVFGVEVLGEVRGADDVEKQHADLPERLLRGLRQGQRGELGTQRDERGVDDRIAEEGALSFEPYDDSFELLRLCRHVAPQ